MPAGGRTSHGFPEFTLGGLLIAPFVPQAIIALVIFLLTRRLRRLVIIDSVFANPPLVEVCLYVVILASVMLLY